MTRQDDKILLELYAAQHAQFDGVAWLDTARQLPAEVVASAALLLAASDWYGHRADLCQVAADLAPGASLPDLVRRSRFDVARFVPMLRARLRYALSLS